ncbi:PAS domain-containing protein [bacterium]|nr:PAS domain-containing protein [bacterium]
MKIIEEKGCESVVGLLASDVMVPFLDGLLSHMQGGVFSVDKDKRITSFSKAAMWITGYCWEEVKGKRCDEVFGSKVCLNSCPFDSIIKKGSSTYRSEIELHDKEGKKIYVNITAFPLRNEKGSIVGMCEIFRDITEVQSLREQLMHTDRFTILGQVAASVAHEINNPLNGILTYIKLISKKLGQDDEKNKQFEKYLTIMERETINMGRIVRNLLNFSRRTEPEIMPIKIQEVIEQCLSLLADQIKLSNINVIKDDGTDLPEVMGDFGQLQQVFMNLILNSIQAMPQGGDLTIQLLKEGSTTKACFIRVNIIDTGCGIPEENMIKIFDPFFTTKSSKSGIGLGFGLSIVERIIKAHHATIKLSSQVGEGTTFSIRFPTK